jgi:hypothetical protein
MGAVISKDDKFKTLKSGRLRRMNRSGTDGSAGLAREMAMLPLLKTPSSVETEGGVMEIRPGCDGHYKLRDQIAMLPTPLTISDNPAAHNKTSGEWQLKINKLLKLLPTPAARDYRGTFKENSKAYQARLDHPRGVNLVEELQRTNNGKNRGLKLQPAFVEWMQGFPIGWTDLKHSETPLSRRSHTRSSRQSVRLKA